MLQAFALALLAWTGHVQYWHVAVLAVCYGLGQHARHARPAVLHRGDGRQGRPHQRHRPQLRHVQRGADGRAGRRRAAGGPVRRGPRLRAERPELRGRDPRPGGDADRGPAARAGGHDRPAGYCRGSPLRRGHSSGGADPEPTPGRQSLRHQPQRLGASPGARRPPRRGARVRPAHGRPGNRRRGRGARPGHAGQEPTDRCPCSSPRRPWPLRSRWRWRRSATSRPPSSSSR